MIKKDYILTRHAEARIKERGISDKEIEEVLKNPDYSFPGMRGERKLEKEISKGRKIRVVYVIEGGKKKIITAMIYK